MIAAEIAPIEAPILDAKGKPIDQTRTVTRDGGLSPDDRRPKALGGCWS